MHRKERTLKHSQQGRFVKMFLLYVNIDHGSSKTKDMPRHDLNVRLCLYCRADFLSKTYKRDGSFGVNLFVFTTFSRGDTLGENFFFTGHFN